jgi:hypothetical protein
MLPAIAVILALVFLVLDRAGVIDEYIEAMARRSGRPVPWQRKKSPPTKRDQEADRRLEVFQQFIDELNAPDEEQE